MRSCLIRALEQAALDYASAANKLDHIFAAKHGLAPLVEQFGSRQAAVQQILRAIAGQTPSAGVFEITTEIAGRAVTVRGAVVDGIVKLGTAFIP